MRHKFLKVAALFVAGAFTMNAWAQTDVTSQYLKNADFEAGTASTAAKIFGYGKDGTPYGLQEVQGWEINYVNVDNSTASYPNSGMAGATLAYGSSTTLKGNDKGAPATGVNDATGNCLGFMAVWGCGGYYSQDVTFPAGIYTMTASFYNQSGTQANTSYTGFIVGEAMHTMPVNTTVGQWVTQSVTFMLTEETAGKIAVGYKSTGNGSGSNPHLFIDDIKLTYQSFEEVNADNPVDMTSLISDPSFENNGSGWDMTTTYTNWGANAIGGDAGKLNKQQWNGNFEVSQTVSNLPNGTYRLSVQGFYRPGGNEATATDQHAVLYANDTETKLMLVSAGGKEAKDDTNGFTTAYTGITPNVYVPNSQNDASKAFSAGAYSNTLKVNVTNNTIKLGVKKETHIGNDWTVIDNFKLEYLGFDLTEANNALTDLINRAQGIVSANEASPKSIEALNTAIAAGQSVAQSKEAIEQASTNLTNAINAANATIAACNEYRTMLALSESMYTNSTADDKSTFEAAINKAKNDFNAAATIDAISAIVTDLQNAQKAYCMVAAPTEGHPFDMTWMVVNPNFDVNTDGWSHNTIASNYGRATNQGGAITGGFYETWKWESYTGDIFQELTGLPKGKYVLTAAAFRDQLIDGASDGDAVYVFANDAETLVNDKTPAFYSVEVSTTTGTLRFGVRSKVEKYRWMGIDNVTLKYIEALDLSEFIAAYNAAREAAIAARDNEEYSKVGGAEKAALLAAIAATPEQTQEALGDATEALVSATAAFTAAKGDYDKLSTEISVAKGLGMTDEAINDIIGNLTGAKAFTELKVAEYTYITTTYTEESPIGKWTENFAEDLDGEGYKAGGEKYLNEWGNATRTSKQTLTLPKGDYALSSIGRGQVGTSGYLYYKIGDTTTKVDFIMKGNRGRGVDVNGVANFSEEGTYNCNNEGFGWEYRFITFHLDAETEVEIGVSATFANAWVSIYAPKLYTDLATKKAVLLSEIESLLEYAPNAKMNAAIESTLNTAKNAAQGVGDTNTKEELEKAYADLRNATDSANVSIAAYEKLAGYISMTEAFTDVTAYEQKYNNGEFATKDVETVRQELNVMRFNAASAMFTNKVDVTGWTGTMGEKNNEHWSGTTVAYKDANSWNDTVPDALTTQISLPKGNYVLKVAGRCSEQNATLKLKVLDQSITFHGKGSYGRGIDVNGNANFSDEGTYARNGEGYGWEWEFLKFTLTEDQTVTLEVNSSYNRTQYVWNSFGDITLWMDDATYMTVYIPTYNKYQADAKALEDKAMEATAKKQLQDALAKATPTTPAELNAQTEALKAAIEKATPSIEVYKTIAEYIAKAKVYDAEKVAAYETKYKDGAYADSEATTVQQELNVITYNYVVNKFNNGVELGKWTTTHTNTSAADLTENHWSGDNERTYKNQKDGENPNQGWHADAWTLNFDQEVVLPAGDYVLKIAGRKSGGAMMKVTVTMDGTVLDSICDFPVSATDLGINKAGAASFDANDPAGFAFEEGKGPALGWQWRFAKFTLATQDTVKIAINTEAKSKNQWMSFGDYTLQMDDATYITYHMPRYVACMELADSLASKPMEADKAAALNAAIAAVDLKSTSPAEIEAKIEALNETIEDVTPSVEAYDAANKYFKVVSNMLATTNLYAQDSCKKYYTEPLAKFDARTLTIEEAKVLTKGGGYKQENKIDDMLLPFWTFDGKQAKDYNTSLYINTWSTEGERDSSMFVAPFFEFYVADNKVLGDSTITATIKGLSPRKHHSFTLRARVRATNDSIKAANAITMTVAEGEPVDISAGDSILGTRFYAKSFTAEGMTDENGTLVVTIKVAKNSNISWLSFRNVRYTEGEDLSAYIENYEMALKNAKDEVAKPKYDDDKAALEAAIANNLFADIAVAKRAQLETATDNLKAILTEALAATAVYNNNQLVAQEIAKAKAIGVDVAAYEANVANKKYADAAAATAGVQAVMVDEYTYVTANYKHNIELGEWTSKGEGTKAADFNNEHWSGEKRSYKNQHDADNQGYNANAWTLSFNQEVVLPAGEYLFKVAGRKSADATLELVASMGETILASENDFPNGSTGLGINKVGATSFDADDAAGFANDNKGRGWQWRYVKFSVPTDTTVKIAINAEAKSKKQWMSFGDYVLLTNSDANVAILDYNKAKATAETTIADEKYKSVVGAARTSLKAAIDKNPGTTAETINAAKAELEAATKAFTEALDKYNALSKAITEAEAIEPTNVGDEAFQIPTAAVEKLEAAIATNKPVLTSTTATVAEIEAAKKALDEAVKAFKSALNAPAKGQRFYIKVATEGHKKNGKALLVTLGKTSDNNPTGYGLNTENEAKDYLNQAFIFTQVKDNVYNISIERAEGTVYLTYGELNGSAAGWKKLQIQATTDATKKGEFMIEASAKAGALKIKNMLENAYIDCQDNGAIYTDTNISNEEFAFEPAEEAEVTVDITIGYATLMLPFNAELPAGMKAYTCEAAGDTLALNEVKTLAANTPYLVEGKGSFEFSDYGMATKDTYESASLTGTYAEAAAPVDSYVLQQLDGVTAFYHVAKGKQPKVGANHCYLTVPAGTAKAPMFSISRGEDTTGIENSTLNAQPSTVIYDLMGRRVNTMVKGNMYIVNGKKVIVK